MLQFPLVQSRSNDDPQIALFTRTSALKILKSLRQLSGIFCPLNLLEVCMVVMCRIQIVF